MRDQIVSILAHVEDLSIGLFGDTERVMESNLDFHIVSVVRAVFSQSGGKAIPSSAFQPAVERAVQKCLAEPHVVSEVWTSTIDAKAFAVPLVNVVRSELAKRFL